MTRRERLMSALRCGRPDRPPVRLLNAAPSALGAMHASWRPLLTPALDKTDIAPSAREIAQIVHENDGLIWDHLGLSAGLHGPPRLRD